MNLERAAAAYVQLGFRLVVQDQSRAPAKLFRHGASDATRDMRLIRRALRSTPEPMLAVRVGEGRLALDIDPRNGGDRSLVKLVTQFGGLPPTWEQETTGGGSHYWFSSIDFRPRGKLAEGIEVVRGNRLLTVSPSVRNGRRYHWLQHPLTTPLAEPPRWLVDAIREPEAPRVVCTAEVSRERRMDRAYRYLERVEPAISGAGGHSRTFWVCQLIVKGFGLEPDDAFHVLSDWNARCDPPWSDRELKRKIREAARHGRRVPEGKFLERKSNAA